IRERIQRRRMVDMVDGDGDSSDIAGGLPVAGLVGEAVGARVAGIGRIGEGAVGIKGEGSVGGCAYQNSGERVSLHVRVIAEYAGSGEGEGGILIGAVGVVCGGRCIVDGIDGDGDGGGIAVNGSIVGCVGETVRAVVVFVGRVGVGSI